LKVKAADTLLTPFVRLLRNGHLSQSEISQRIQRKYTTTSVKGQRKEGRRKKTFITKSTYNNFRQQKSETGVQKL
jgi:DNA-binding transcriptional regulator GbsR (MarR family)